MTAAPVGGVGLRTVLLDGAGDAAPGEVVFTGLELAPLALGSAGEVDGDGDSDGAAMAVFFELAITTIMVIKPIIITASKTASRLRC